MKHHGLRALIALFPLVLVATGLAMARDMTFEDRVKAQEAIERVYYSHQIGATGPFEEAVPRAVLENKVRRYLQQTVALEVYWKTKVTDEILQRELDRIARGTRLPDRLRELFAALNGDPFLIKECLARATLVDRLTRNFYAFDPALHAEARLRAGEIHRQLMEGDLDPWSDHPNRSVIELVERDADAGEPLERERQDGLLEQGGPARRLLSPEEFRKERARWPETSGQAAPVAEEREAFVIRVVLSDGPGASRVAGYVIPKTSWDLWWETAKRDLQGERVAAAASDVGSLPLAADRPTAALETSSSTTDLVSDLLTADGLPCTDDDTWDNGILDDVPDGRGYHTAVWTGSLMVVWGGLRWDINLDTGGRYDPATDTWTPTSTLGAPSPRTNHTAVWTGSRMVVWGGDHYYSGTYLETGGQYDPAADTWTPTSTVGAPSVRSRHTAIWTGSRMVVWGGIYWDYEGGISVYLNTGGRYDPATDTWTATSTLGAPSARASHTVVWTGSLMVVWGGMGIDSTRFNTGGRYDVATDTWTPTSTVGAPSVRSRHTAIWTGSLMVVWGGYNGYNYFDTGGRYDPAADSWTATSTLGTPLGRYAHTAIWTGSLMVVWGGSTNTSPYYTNTGGRYNPATDSWTATSTLGTPLGRYAHTAIWTGSLMVVWGGSGFVPCLDTGGRYDPTTDAWTATATGQVLARRSHTAVWTGNLMVVWGGIDPEYYGYFNTGGRYDPATDAWTPTSTVGAPSARSDHTAVWTGSLMVVWGGRYYSGTYFDTGGRYDPAADTWTAISTLKAPSARYYHTAVWTGSLMVVWGGSDDVPLKTGGLYDPATDTWTTTSTAGALSARTFHTAVWTGSRMVIWGGYDDSTYFNTGGRYDPATDSWTPTSTVEAPSARDFHAAVWTGNRMVVWGGYTNTSPYRLNTGGRYDPATDSWTATSALGAPSGREQHTAIWTGNRMVVWGGRNESFYPLNTGGQYDPATDIWTETSNLGAPSARGNHTAVWTGSLMVVWGGSDDISLNTGGRYVLGVAADDDGDGFSECQGDCNDSAASVYPGAPPICDGINNDCSDPAWPAVLDEVDADGDGFQICAGDCDDADPDIFPNAVEINDGKDNQCPGNPGFGIIDEISGALAFSDPADPTEISWPAQPGATAYEVIRAIGPLFPPVCAGGITGAPSWSDSEIPPAGGTFYYLVRPVAPYLGSWGQDSSGVERTGLCGEE